MTTENYYTSVKLDRLDPFRQESHWLTETLRQAESKILLLWRNKILLLDHMEPLALSPDLCLSLIDLADQQVFLGEDEQKTPWFALDFSSAEKEQRPAFPEYPSHWRDLRAATPLLDRDTSALLGYAVSLMRWHRRHRYCGTCGHATKPERSGHIRRCSNIGCNLEHYPRTDPAIIVLIEDGDRLLLGRQSWWNPGMHSLLAGYVEPGESLEDAVRREVMEEAGVEVDTIRYHSSQPWPFSSSIMLGFIAKAKTTQIQVNTDELESAEWFSLDQLCKQQSSESFHLPREDAIARRIIDQWIENKTQ